MGVTFLPTAGPVYSLSGRQRRLSAGCSMSSPLFVNRGYRGDTAVSRQPISLELHALRVCSQDVPIPSQAIHMKTLRIFALLSTLAASAIADGKVGFTPADTVATVLARQVGQRVELRMNSGEKLAGKVEAVGEKTVHISSLAGQEFFDAVVAIKEISAVIIRTGGK